jgi:hypothetical protein
MHNVGKGHRHLHLLGVIKGKIQIFEAQSRLKTYRCVVLFSDYLAVVLINCTGKQSLTKHVNDLISVQAIFFSQGQRFGHSFQC